MIRYAALTVLAGLFMAQPVALVQAQEAEAIEEVVVTGSYIRRANQSDSTSPIEVVGADDMSSAAAFKRVGPGAQPAGQQRFAKPE